MSLYITLPRCMVVECCPFCSHLQLTVSLQEYMPAVHVLVFDPPWKYQLQILLYQQQLLIRHNQPVLEIRFKLFTKTLHK